MQLNFSGGRNSNSALALGTIFDINFGKYMKKMFYKLMKKIQDSKVYAIALKIKII